MKRKTMLLAVILAIFGLSGCLGGFGFGTNTFTTPFDQRYKMAAALNPKQECTLLMLDKVWATSKAMFFRPTTNKQLFVGALKGLSDVAGKSFDLPEYKSDKDYTLANFWPILVESKNSSDKTLNELCYSSVYGLIKSLDDKHTYFLDAKKAPSVVGSIAGKGYHGLGFWMRVFPKPKVRLFIDHVFDDSPAQRAGLKKYDEFLSVGGERVSAIKPMDLMHKFRGKDGSEVAVVVMRKGWKSPKKFTLKRAHVGSKNAFCKMVGDVVYCRLLSFSMGVFADLEESFNKLSKGKSEKLIIDVRSNSGGAQSSVLEVLNKGWFAGRFTAVTIKKKGQFTPLVSGGSKKPLFIKYKTVVLTNRVSASASEILVGALRDSGRAIIIGEKTFGKGRVQGVIFVYGAILFLTHMEYYTPNGDIIQGKGLKPDISVPHTLEDYNVNRDPQLERAVKFLHSNK